MKIIIIGSIAAGVSAAARLAAAQRGAQITVYEKGGFYSSGTGGLPHYLCEDLDSLNKAIQAKETELNAQGITAHLRHEVRGIDAAARKVTVCEELAKAENKKAGAGHRFFQPCAAGARQ